MKILYAIQATGNGHISRAHQILPYLQKYGQVDTMLSGANATLPCKFDITYKSNGLSLFYKECGGLDYGRMLIYNSLARARRDAKSLPVEQYDLIINDFDYVTALACRMKAVPSIHFGHQASFMSASTPRPEKRSVIGEYILKHYAKASHYLGLHFRAYDDFIMPPVIKDEILNANPNDRGHITAYLPSFDSKCLIKHFKQLSDLEFHFFSHDVKSFSREGNISYFPISNEEFTKSLIDCHGIITGGGFETPAESLYLGKRLMSIPIRNHYEQKCNAAGLSLLGATVLEDVVESKWNSQITSWLDSDRTDIHMQANNISSTLDYLLEINEMIRGKGLHQTNEGSISSFV